VKRALPVASFAALACLVAAQLSAQEAVDADKLPPKVAQAVKSRFPGATIVKATKEMEDGHVVYDIEMIRSGKKHEMDCREDGTIVDIQNEIPASDLPPAAQNAIKAKYPGSKIKEVGEILVVNNGQEKRDHFEVLIETAEQKEVELTVSLDGTKIE
jgi:hypothetical protein